MDVSFLDLFLMVLINGLVDCTLAAYISGKQSKKAIVRALKDPDEETMQAVANLVPMILEAQIKTGRKLKDEEGHEHEEVLPFLSFAGRELSNALLYKIKAMRGGLKAQGGAELTEAMGLDPSLLGSVLGPRKGQTTADWALEQAIPRVMPMVEKKLEELLTKKGWSP